LDSIERAQGKVGTVVLAVAGIGMIIVVDLILLGGQTSQILSTVGSSISHSGGNAGSTAAPSRASAGAAEAEGGADPGDGPPESLRDQLKIVYTGSLQLVVTDLPAALASAKASVLATGGYVGASQESNNGERSVASITCRIPADRWDGAIDDLRGLADKVVAEQTQATEVGGQLVDLEARLRNLRASEAPSGRSPRAPGMSPTCSTSRPSSPTCVARSSSSTGSAPSSRTRWPMGPWSRRSGSRWSRSRRRRRAGTRPTTSTARRPR
jgi:hypothetical protein